MMREKFRLRGMFGLFGASLLAASVSWAGADIRFEPRDLEAARVLIRPEESTVYLDGPGGEFRPGPALRFVGVHADTFEIDLGLGGELADVRFNQVTARNVEVHFEDGRLRAEVPFEDREKAIRSMLGAIHFRGVRAVIWIRPVESATGHIDLAYEGGEFRGELIGTGLLASGAILRTIKSAGLKALDRNLVRLLAKPEVSSAVEKGLVKYAQFRKDGALERYVPGSLTISDAGIAYQAE
jgi:hypothetical protein